MSVHEVRLAGWSDKVRVFYTTRTGGRSEGPYRGFNLGLHVGDSEQSVQNNRRELLAKLPPRTRIAWLNQVHGTQIVEASDGLGPPITADGCWTKERGIACAVMVADCLPVILSDRAGSVIAAVHAGWRGLAAGVLESAVASLGVAPQEVYAWLGPAIGRDRFEVGPEVRSAFIKHDASAATERCFRPSDMRVGHYLADLPGLAQKRLRGLGLADIQTFSACTVDEPTRFFSYRRDGVTGRMACLILRNL
ncbi:peptidoglycan editing factor PgeF [Congregibacter variabilis]|uniref:Purine nucleoside phosphorylase n=1 Tax=Congregibacter variabilis TaxID=3081200 RepID=A0ABZ0I345_9GAMM|nr:peptidoglycan editing factor PgeF [Congregibacter sp. IMCC43200]